MPEEKPQENPKPRSAPMKVIIIVLALMIAEGVAVFAFVSLTGRGPQDAVADLAGEAEAGQESRVEIQLVADKFQNMQTGHVWIWSLEVYLQVKRKNEQAVMADLERRSAEIRERVNQIMRRAEHRHLTQEPDLRTINRQFTALANDVFGTGPDGSPRVERVIIARCQGHAVN